jgi:hypothetical protein
MTNCGKIKLRINDKDLENLQFQDVLPCYRQTPETTLYYNEHNASICQIFDESPKWVHDLSRLIPQDFVHHDVSVIRLLPGHTIPYHRDNHYRLQEKYGAGDSWRYLIFLQDWHKGHYFEINDEPVVKWTAGHWIKFHRDEWHLAGNMGIKPFYSAQITTK